MEPLALMSTDVWFNAPAANTVSSLQKAVLKSAMSILTVYNKLMTFFACNTKFWVEQLGS